MPGQAMGGASFGKDFEAVETDGVAIGEGVCDDTEAACFGVKLRLGGHELGVVNEEEIGLSAGQTGLF